VWISSNVEHDTKTVYLFKSKRMLRFKFTSSVSKLQSRFFENQQLKLTRMLTNQFPVNGKAVPVQVTKKFGGVEV
jgi:hypothetical protein